ncbi:MAG: ATP-binding protein [Gemmatimonadaceae bacterium]
MSTSAAEFAGLLSAAENSRIEFKTAENRYDFEKLVQYVVAIANEGGGQIILGVNDVRPRTVVGTQAFLEPGKTIAGVLERVGRRVDIEEYTHNALRVLIVHVPGRDRGSAWCERGTYWKRSGESLLPMRDDELRQIHSEIEVDFSAEVVAGLQLADLDDRSISEFARRWSLRDGRPQILNWNASEALRNAELMNEQGITRAALLLFGTPVSVGQYLPQAEVIFEYRSSESAGPAQDRVEFRSGFMSFHDALWERINLRNDRQSFQDGFFRTDVLTFDEGTIREGILNAVCHRDYRANASIFIRQYNRRLEVVSPGGFPAGVTAENVLDQQNPRNRRLAEALGKCGLIERAGQGVNLMVERSVAQSKPLPDFSGTALHEVRLTLRGEVANPAFLRFLEQINESTMQSFSTADLLALDSLQRDEQVPDSLRSRLPRLVELGIVETVGRGKGTRYLLSRGLFSALGQTGTYTRRKGLDDETNKELLVRHLRDARGGSPFRELQQVLPAISRRKLKGLLDSLRSEGRVALINPEKRRWAKWGLPNAQVSMDAS